MLRSTDRIVTTHTGSLARPPALEEALLGRGDGDTAAHDSLVRDAVSDVVRRQVELGLDVVSDGEMSKTGFHSYVSERLGGLESTDLFQDDIGPMLAEMEDFPGWGAELRARFVATRSSPHVGACVGELTYANPEPLRADLESLGAARDRWSPNEVFMPSISPGFLTASMPNRYYSTHEELAGALAEALKPEYDAIHQAGFVLQLDCPDLATWGRARGIYGVETFDEWRRLTLVNVEALNEATRDIPPEAMRIHVCWANYPGPHHLDVPLREIVDILLRARPAGLSIEAANPRHEHEWAVFRDVKLPDGKVVIPGVVDSTSVFVEHPELVAQRIVNFAGVVGRESVIAGTDCGFASMAAWVTVDPGIAWAKLRSVVEGAELATRELWP
jgi:5-methyltetrahydropteroyltriglutamate--homocysteine methyltransferase